jgi:enolase
MHISKITAEEVLDSRGNPTVWSWRMELPHRREHDHIPCSEPYTERHRRAIIVNKQNIDDSAFSDAAIKQKVPHFRGEEL